MIVFNPKLERKQSNLEPQITEKGGEFLTRICEQIESIGIVITPKLLMNKARAEAHSCQIV
jgi:hypothetical protein